jgi:hypothetical protein
MILTDGALIVKMEVSLGLSQDLDVFTEIPK